MTHVNFMDPTFADVTASTFRIDAVAEYVMTHNWVLWIRPLTIDVVSAPELGGPITTLQFRRGVAYRFGERGTASRRLHRHRPRCRPSRHHDQLAKRGDRARSRVLRPTLAELHAR